MNGLLPQNGRIVIVDDLEAEVQPLMKILGKHRIPFNYYAGNKATDLPKNSHKNDLRIFFLDLNIFELTRKPAAVISALHPIINSIVPNNPSPYLLIIWSKKAVDYAEELDRHFAGPLKNKAPVQRIFLQKDEFFEHQEDGAYTAIADCLPKLEQRIDAELSKLSLFKGLISWENLIHHSVNSTMHEFTSFFPFDIDWDKKSKAIMFHLARSVTGDDHIETLSDQEKLIKAFHNINAFLSDKIESESGVDFLQGISDIVDDQFSSNKKQSILTQTLRASLNRKLHFSNAFREFEQGNLYYPRKNDKIKNQIIWNKLLKPEKTDLLQKIRQNARVVLLDITPVCDYAQHKDYIRLLYGILIDFDFSEHFKSAFFYRTPVLSIDDGEKILVFDFRHLLTITKHDAQKNKMVAKYKLRKEICTDIQALLSNQVNRPGISFL